MFEFSKLSNFQQQKSVFSPSTASTSVRLVRIHPGAAAAYLPPSSTGVPGLFLWENITFRKKIFFRKTNRKTLLISCVLFGIKWLITGNLLAYCWTQIIKLACQKKSRFPFENQYFLADQVVVIIRVLLKSPCNGVLVAVIPLPSLRAIF